MTNFMIEQHKGKPCDNIRMTLTPIYFDTLTEYVKESLSPIKQKYAQMAEDLVDP